jgi:hypothetical protein
LGEHSIHSINNDDWRRNGERVIWFFFLSFDVFLAVCCIFKHDLHDENAT